MSYDPDGKEMEQRLPENPINKSINTHRETQKLLYMVCEAPIAISYL